LHFLTPLHDISHFVDPPGRLVHDISPPSGVHQDLGGNVRREDPNTTTGTHSIAPAVSVDEDTSMAIEIYRTRADKRIREAVEQDNKRMKNVAIAPTVLVPPETWYDEDL
jgi:hypothetical protein